MKLIQKKRKNELMAEELYKCCFGVLKQKSSNEFT